MMARECVSHRQHHNRPQAGRVSSLISSLPLILYSPGRKLPRDGFQMAAWKEQYSTWRLPGRLGWGLNKGIADKDDHSCSRGIAGLGIRE